MQLTREVFTQIYENNFWGSPESVSGPGSEIGQTETLIGELNILLDKMGIKSILDLPCGDLNWMRKVNLSGINYVGADIVVEIISNNTSRFGCHANMKFEVLDLITDPLPECDLVIVRDCLVHLSYDDISKAIANIKSSCSKYLLATNFVDHRQNHDIKTGDWRPLNLLEPPFRLTSPILTINENCTEDGGKYADKSMALWCISDI